MQITNKSTSIRGVNTLVCEEKKRAEEKRKRTILFIILLGSLYYFIELYVKIKIGMYGKL